MTRYLFFFGVIATLTSTALAHQGGGDSYLHLTIDGNAVQAKLGISLRTLSQITDFDDDGDYKVTKDEMRRHLDAIADYARSRLKFSVGDIPCNVNQVKHEAIGRFALISFLPNCPMPLRTITIHYGLFFDVDPLHRGLLRLEHEDRTQTAIFTPTQRVQNIQLVDFSLWSQFWGYIKEGIWHIWIGFDHILFLLTLLLPAVLHRRLGKWIAVSSFREALLSVVKVVTAFTMAHSITLSAAAFGFIRPPSRLVESLIALSVLVAAINNIYPIMVKRIWIVAFGFGLIHGFGFATVLQELELPKGALALSLFGFNLGVEIGQVALVAVFLPLAFVIRKEWIYTRVGLSVGSACIAGIALTWFTERALDLPPLLPSAPPVDPRSELARILPYLGSHLGSPLSFAGITLLGLLGLHWTVEKIRVPAGSSSNSSTYREKHFIRYFSYLAFLLIMVGIGQTLSEARAEAIAMQRAASVTASLTEPLRRRLAVSEPSDLAYQEQVEALNDAVIFLTRKRDDAKTDITRALEQLAQGQSKPAQTILEMLAQQAEASGRITEAAMIQRHRGSVAALADLRRAIEAYREATKLDPKTWRTWSSLAYLLRHAGRLKEAERVYTKALELSRAAKDEARVALAYERLGAVSQARRRPEEAEAKYQEAISLYGTRRDEAGLARIYSRLGDLYATQGNFNEARAMYRDALAIHQTLGDSTRVGVDYANLGGAYIAQGLFKPGKEMYHEALKINEALGQKAGMALVYSDLGWVARRLGNWQQAELMFHKALLLDEELGYEPGMASHCTNLGEVYRRVGNLSQAIVMFRRAVDIDKQLGNKPGLAINYNNLGSLYQSQGALDRAESMYKQSLAINEKLDRAGGRANVYSELGHLYHRRGDTKQAHTMYRESLALFRQVGANRRADQIQSWLDGLNTASPAL
jgi:tetratricopeptide (TPR) repeat protein